MQKLVSKQGGGAGPARQPDPADEGYGALGGPGAQNQGPTLRELIKKAAPEGMVVCLPVAFISLCLLYVWAVHALVKPSADVIPFKLQTSIALYLSTAL